ncbi:MAG: DUF5723 family protein [Saprospiraceae bacterium]|nr:DUF5723 family protein [Saprospiraceae bacterium]
MLRSIIFMFSFLLLGFSISAQEQIGLRLDHYSGINAIFLNPSGHRTTPFNWDLNLVEAGAFAENNYAYLINTKLTDLLRSSDEYEIVYDLKREAEFNTDKDVIYLDYSRGSKRRYFSAIANVVGPSFYIRLNPRHTVGLFSRTRTFTGTRNIPAAYGYYNYTEQPLNESFTVEPFNLSGMVWNEIGLNYAFTTETTNGQWTFGANFKYLMGYEGYFVNNQSNFDYTKLASNDIQGEDVDLTFGFTDGNTNAQDFQLEQNGSGFGLDLGATYTFGESPETYEWKLGFSLIDLGRIRFNNNAQQHSIQQINPVTIDTDLYRQLNGLSDAEDYIQLLSAQTLGDSTASQVGNEFDVWLPQAFSVQFDRRFSKNWYIGAALVEQIPVGEKRLQRGGLLVVSPRFESRWFGASIPVSLYNWEQIRYGAALRLGFLTLGTDNLGSIVQNQDFSGSDFYIALKINPFNLGNKEDKKGWINRSKKRSRTKVECYEFN